MFLASPTKVASRMCEGSNRCLSYSSLLHPLHCKYSQDCKLTHFFPPYFARYRLPFQPASLLQTDKLPWYILPCLLMRVLNFLQVSLLTKTCLWLTCLQARRISKRWVASYPQTTHLLMTSRCLTWLILCSSFAARCAPSTRKHEHVHANMYTHITCMLANMHMHTSIHSYSHTLSHTHSFPLLISPTLHAGCPPLSIT